VREHGTTTQHVLVCREVAGRLGQNAILLEAGERHSRCAYDTFGDVVLDRENVVAFGVVRFGPHTPSGRGLGQRGADAKTIASATDAALQQILRIQQASDLSGGDI
jgi:hypothetical protein